jgi:alkylation response protein AidB-like acyl-CoA dehydrogenase
MMDFTFTEEQQEMAAALRRLLSDICAPAALRSVFDGADRQSEARWQRLAELGLFGVLAGEEHGGLGLAPVDFVLLAQEAGRAALPEPLCEQAGVAVPALAALPGAEEIVAPAAAGRTRLAIVHPHNPHALVPPGVTHWLLCEADGIYLYAAEEVEALPLPSIDAARHLARPQGARDAKHRRAQGAQAQRLAQQALEHGALYAAAQCVGLTETLLALAVDYAKQRTQFNRAIGSYQAIKHQLANVQVRLEFARPVVYAAAACLAEDARSAARISHAKLAAGDAAELAARTAMQVHGAMGYSWEVDLHLYMKRVWALLGAWGDRSFHARRVQQLLTDGGFALGPETTFAARAGEVTR